MLNEFVHDHWNKKCRRLDKSLILNKLKKKLFCILWKLRDISLEKS